MPFTRDVIAAAPILSAAVVRKWGPLAESFGWTEDHQPIGQDHLVDLIQWLGEAALAREAGALAASRDLIRCAFQHGRERRVDGFSEEMVFQEYHLLRQGLWEELRNRNSEFAAETIMRIDAEITMATAASLHGFHADENTPDLESLVDEIARRWAG